MNRDNIQVYAQILDKNKNPYTNHTILKDKGKPHRIEAIIRDGAGNVKFRTEFDMKSFLDNHIRMVRGSMASATATSYVSLIDEDGNSDNRYLAYYDGFSSGVASETKGIVVGTDDGGIYALAIDNYKLGAKIAHGESAGELLKHQTRVDPPWSVADGYRFCIRGFFTNNSGGTITVKEIGLLTYRQNDSCLIARDLEDDSGTISLAVSDGDTIEIKYYISLLESEGFTSNFANALRSFFGYYAYTTSLTTIDGGSAAADYSFKMWTVRPNATVEAVDAIGPVVGTGSAALDKTDYVLGTQIANGTSAGQLYHHDVGITDATIEGDTGYVLVERIFSNLSGSSITVNEVGLYTYWDNHLTGDSIMIHRALSGGITIPHEEAMLLRYKYQTTL